MIITKQSDLDAFCKKLKSFPFITIDTEFLREKTYYPKLCLIQISGPDKDARAIDPLADIDLSPIFSLLTDQNILKIFHAGRQDLEIFYRLMNKVPHPLFDTQIAAMVCGYGHSVGYHNLVKDITGEKLDKSVQYTNWAVRPLSKRQIEYALGDVTHLIDIYLALNEKLEEQGRVSWVFQEEEILADPATYQNPPEDAWKRIKIRHPKPKTLAVLKELAAWREKRAQKKDIPRNWVLRDETLADMAIQLPKNKEHLAKIRNIPGDLAKKDMGQKLLTIIKDSLESDPKNWPTIKKSIKPSDEVTSAIEVLKLLLKIRCATYDVAPKLVASSNDLEALAKGETNNLSVLKGWRKEIFGEAAIDLLQGKTAIAFRNGKIVQAQNK